MNMQIIEGKSALMQDAGEFVPEARKHNAELTGKQSQNGATLAELWPEPDWKGLVTKGEPVDLVAAKFVGYNSLRTKPRPPFVRGLGGAWVTAYRCAIGHLREIYENAQSLKELETVNSQLCQRIGIDFANLRNLGVEKASVFWAAGMGGEKILKSPASGTLRLREMKRWLHKMGWPASDAAWRTSIIPLKLTDKTWRVVRVEGDKWVAVVETIYLDEAQALSAAIETAEKEDASKSNEARLVPKRPRAKKEDERVGPDYRNGTDISAEHLMSEFNLRAIQYGNSVTLKDRQRWLNQTFDALADMADVLKMKRKWLGLSHEGRSLALAIGARGIGNSNAHYEPLHKIINQTYRNGAGVIAHEMGHAIDHRLAITMGLFGFASDQCLFARHSDMLTTEKAHVIAEKYLAVGIGCGQASQFHRQAVRIASTHRAGSYWMERTELFARSFEAFVQDSLIEIGRSSPWLVHGTLEADYEGRAVSACPYPIGEERKWLFEAHRQLIESMVAPVGLGRT